MKRLKDAPASLFFYFYYLRRKVNVLLFSGLIQLFLKFKGVKMNKDVRFDGYPVIRIYPGSLIHLGGRCKFNSAPSSVEVGLLRRCTFLTIRKSAEIIIGKDTGVSGLLIVAAESVRIGDNVLIGANSMIIDNDFHSSNPHYRHIEGKYDARPVIIEDNVFIGFNCAILKGVTIGKNAVIGANSLVNQCIPENSVAMGNPCKVIIRRNWGNQDG